MNPGFRRFLTLLVVFVMAFLTVFVVRKMQDGSSLMDIITGRDSAANDGQFTLRDKPALNLQDVQVLAAINAESAALVKTVVPSVVSIDTAGVRHDRFRDVWGRTWVQPRTVQGQGSGVIVTQEGHVLTNHHVIQGNPRIRLTMHDGTVHSAKVIGSDPAVDIAVLKIDGKGPFAPLKFGDSSKIEVGNIVFAVGSPFGLGETVTDGKISAKKRTFSDSRVDLLQTSAAINPGNSGGPLVNILGEIVGINSRIYSTDKKNPGFQGISFAIPSNAALKTMKDILARGRPIRGFLGMAFEDLDPYTRREFGYQGRDGIRIVGLVPDSPAEKAGLREDDIIISYDGNEIADMRRLIGLIQQSEVGSMVNMVIWREGAKHTITATVGEADNFSQRILRDEEDETTSRPDPKTVLTTIGLVVREANEREQSLGVTGVVIKQILAGSKLSGSLHIGDVVHAINGRAVQSVEDFNTRLAASASVQNTELEIHRGRQSFRIRISVVKAQ
ncbi:trypsin-like peptidase domain-containing protein [Verrucomicrobiaceae bacterium R5-34]|uniref:Trypsin-like peptidase domain-containing protein n=1 Tax=Oceaniferula flava TaxID=2800421 RepID=A0AAE2SBA2_9BACT|nr:trypsin-like peptidase domain-containing protein [Oceaniferula flavus]MBK1831944.1 trypsin-like peptidase domain-containing protein [Verrucomicrobiaceae bacterium R5-34]MBK1855288.1 trypsin-like peptidase domain-containing protein [Oceaniferula flavus]MBM1136594.1 trypsin-like peptidase domain-containing protein [Oceaniferula flavus]